MPAGFTHIFLAKSFSSKAAFSNHRSDLLLKSLLAQQLEFFQLGALGPDLPYSQMARFGNEEEEIADLFHYEKTDQIPLKGLERTKALPEGEKRDQAFCFFLGYLAHYVADGVIHPYVRDKVGDYGENATEHRLLEMRLDVYFINHLTKKGGAGLSINKAKIQDELDDVKGRMQTIEGIFAEVIQEVYGIPVEPNRIGAWVSDMRLMFESAANEGNQFYTQLPGINRFLYFNLHQLKKKGRRKQDLLLHVPIDRERNFRAKRTHFFQDCLPQFYQRLLPIARAAADFVYGELAEFPLGLIEPINLDTGRLLSAKGPGELDHVPFFWS